MSKGQERQGRGRVWQTVLLIADGGTAMQTMTARTPDP